ncbi:MAG: NnrS family protein [Cardiobacteriaceae bacterium]|nr:NnrS family protein [Cardiobacteriaceae bacterium]
MWRNYPFRVFFPLSCLGAWISVLPWLTLWLTPQHAHHFPLHFHAFAFINLCSGAAFIGFLFTALPSWTKSPHAPVLSLPIHSQTLLALWIGLLFSMPYPTLAKWLAVLMWGYLSALVIYWTIYTQKPKLLSFGVLLLMIWGLSLRYVSMPTGVVLHQMVDVMLMGVGMVNFRIGNVVGNEAIKPRGRDFRFVPNLHYKNIATLVLGLYVLVSALGADSSITGWLALAVASAFMARIHDWHSLWLLNEPYTRINYAVALVLALGYFGVGMALLFYPTWYSPARHLLAISAMLLMILTTMSIAGMRHSGLDLKFSRDTRLALGLVLLAGLVRSFGFYHLQSALMLYILPSFMLFIAFALYTVRYLHIFHYNAPR